MISLNKKLNAQEEWLKVKTYLDKINESLPHFPCRLIIIPRHEIISSRVITELQKNGHQLIIKPVGLSTEYNIFNQVLKEEELEIFSLNSDKSREGEWDIALYTSGSTGKPKLYGYTTPQIEKTLSWYKEIYRIDDNTVIISTLPLSYNFTFIAGLKLSQYCDINYCNFADHRDLITALSTPPFRKQKVILLANPIFLNEIAKNFEELPENTLVDSGGAPLSKSALQWFRSKNIDVREGYGLTETCSLTHFDKEGNEKSIGSVGHGMPGVETSLVMKEGKPFIQISSPNIGCELDDKGHTLRASSRKNLMTSDLGDIDQDGRLTILGRSSDYSINGVWPRQILDLISPILGHRCALVMTPSDHEIIIKSWDLLDQEERNKISSLLSDTLKIDFKNIQYITTNVTCHSYKLDRKINVSAG